MSEPPRCRRSRRDHDDSPDTTAAFARQAHLAAGPERDLLCEEVVEAWLPMAHRMATRFSNKGESLDDLKQIAAMGSLKAVQRFDPERGAFEAYAVPTITGELRRHFRDHRWDVHVPRSVQELRNKVRVARRDLVQQPGSLDAELSFADGEGCSMADRLGAPDPSFDLVAAREAAKAGLRHLPERERTILYLRFFRDAMRQPGIDSWG
ncbi:sigma-70 family RNA polymerase sigma factor [Streptomyces sp. NPDC050147]|uniref:sigma-70 family RNA polymerase sigma factor n=1 Tax=Streptomyces sp. NPDC050147 TaxID=3155513 RepID=UPI003419ACA3